MVTSEVSVATSYHLCSAYFLWRDFPLCSSKASISFVLCWTSRGHAAPATEPSSELTSGLKIYAIIYPKEITNASFQYTTLALEHSNSQKSSLRHIHDFLLISPEGLPLTIPTIFTSFTFSFKTIWKKIPSYIRISKSFSTVKKSYSNIKYTISFWLLGTHSWCKRGICLLFIYVRTFCQVKS